MGEGGTYRGTGGHENLKINMWPKVQLYKQVHLFEYVNGRKFTTLSSVYSKIELKSPYFVWTKTENHSQRKFRKSFLIRSLGFLLH